ncbi:hypothetical protein K438DRAFT_1841873 [Mycena galopus ATCC 62051]|nr:hypothetical protein K438DRAFT_1841873 [Mycena galopus ATCC 62051]
MMEGDSLLPLHTDALRVAIVAENFLPKIDGSTITLAHLLQHLHSTGIRAMLLGPETGMTSYAGASLFGTFGVPLRVYPGLKVNFISPAFLAALREFSPHVIHLVDPIWLGVQGLAALTLLFPNTPIVTSHHTNLPTYATVFGYPYYHFRTWAVHAYLHSFARYTLVPSRSTASLLAEKGFGNLRVVGRGVDDAVFHPSFRSQSLRASWGARPDDVVILSVGRLSPEKNLGLLVHAYAALLSTLPSSASLPSNAEGGKSAAPQTHLVFVGDGPFRASLQALCVELGVPAIFTGQLTGRRLSEAFASADVMSSPSITETFGQVTLQGMAAGLPVVGLYVEGTADLVVHGFGFGHSADAGDEEARGVDGRGGGRTVEALRPPMRTHDSGVAFDSPRGLVGFTSPHAFDARDPHAEGDEEDGMRVPDSAVCFSPASDVTFVGDGDGDGEGRRSMEELVLPGAVMSDLPTFSPLPKQGSSVEEDDAYASDPFGSADPSAPRVGCFRTLAPLMRPEAPAFPAIVRAYAGLIGALVRSPSLREEMGKRAHARSTRFRWAGCSQRVVDAYIDACKPLPGSASPASTSPSTSATSTSAGCSGSAATPIPGGGRPERDLEAQEEDPLLLHRTTSGRVADDKGIAPESRPLLAGFSRDRKSAALVATRGMGAVGVGGMVQGVAAGWTWVVDALVVVHALVAATLSHAAYMVPASEDVWGR